MSLWKYEVNNIGFGTRTFRFRGAGRQIFGPWLVNYALQLAALVLVVACMVAVSNALAKFALRADSR